jgi:hypothetical protein
MKDTTADWIRRHEQLVGWAVFFPSMIFAVILVVFLVPPESRDFAVRAVMAVCLVSFAAFYAWVRSPLTRLKSATAGIPVLTIGDHFKRTSAYHVRIMTPVLAAWIAGVLLFGAGLPKRQQQALAIGGGLVLSIPGWMFIRNQLRCPRCGTDFKRERFAKLGRWSFDTRGAAELWDACPHCGVSFNDPWR